MKKPNLNLEWNEGMSAGIPAICTDHQRFVSLINELNRSLNEEMKATEIHKRLQLVIDDTERHFKKEEMFFQEWRYPNAEVHASSHKLVLKMLKNIQNSFIPFSPEADWPDAALKIKNILLSHIIVEDMQCKFFQTGINQ